MRFGFLNLKRSAVSTTYSLSELFHPPPSRWNKVCGNNKYCNITTFEDPATIARRGIKTISAEIAHPSFGLLFGFVLAIATPFPIDAVNTSIKAGIQAREWIRLPVAAQEADGSES